MLAIFKKEFKSYFRSMTGWIFLAVTLFFTGWYFRYYGLMGGYPYVSYIISGVLFIFLFCLPLLTMRSFSEEARQKTDQLLYTSPVPVWKIIMGKYLAVVVIYAITITVMSIYPWVLRIYGEVPMAENYLAFFGFLLFGMTCLAIGILVSVLTENQIIAAVLTFFTLLLGVMIPGISNMISINGNAFTRILKAFDLTSYMNASLYGMFYWPSFLYYFSVIFICLYLTGFVILKRRWHIATHGIMRAITSASGMLLMFGIIIVINIAVNMLPDRYLMKDMTYNAINSITKDTEAILDNLTKPVTIYVLADPETKDETIESTLNCMDDYSSMITVEYISPSENPYFYTTYTDTCPDDNSMIVVANNRSKLIEYYDCYQVQYNYSYNEQTGSYDTTDYQVSGYDGEGRILSAINYVMNSTIPKIYCITGHDEFTLDQDLMMKIENANFDVENINLLTYDSIPEDADMVFVIAPLVDLNEEEVGKIREFLQKGKDAIFVVAFSDADELTTYYSLLSDYGISVVPGLVYEEGRAYYNTQPFYLLPDIVNTDITQGIYSALRNKYVYMPYAKGLLVEEFPDVTTMTFLRTTENSYSKIDFETSAEQTDADIAGPFALGVYAEKIYPQSSSEITVFSSDYFLYQDVNMAVNGNNYEVFMNALFKMADGENTTSIPVKSYSFNQIIMDETARSIFSILLIGILPVVLLIMGFNVWFLRRKK